MPGTSKPYDASYKKLFANQEVVASLLQGFLPGDILKDMDLSSLEPLPTEHITSDNRERKNDLLWKIRYGDSICCLVIILEFQSVEDWWMALRVSVYSGLILQDIIRYGNLGKYEKLPIVFPIVLYNGDKKWQAPTELKKLFFDHAEVIDIYQPQQKYYLLDIKHIIRSNVNTENNLSVKIFDFENAKTIEEIIAILKKLAGILPENEKLQIHEAFINLLTVNILNDPELGKQISNCKTVQEAYNMLAERTPLWKINLQKEAMETGYAEGMQKGMEEGMQKGMQKGMEEGMQKGYSDGKEAGVTLGMKKIVCEILINKFGNLQEDIEKIINEINADSLLEKIAVNASKLSSFGELKAFIEDSRV